MTPQAPPPDPPGDSAPARCPNLTKRGKPCPYVLKPGESHCWSHDPARDAERRAAGAVRNGDPGTELGSFEGITRRAVRILEELEDGTTVKDDDGEEHFVPKIEPAVANARRNTLKFLAEMVARRDQSQKAAKALEEINMGRGDADDPPRPTSLEDLT